MDTFWLNTAFYQASQVLGNTGRNPAVGCVLINKNYVYPKRNIFVEKRHAYPNYLTSFAQSQLSL